MTSGTNHEIGRVLSDGFRSSNRNQKTCYLTVSHSMNQIRF